MAPPVQQPSQTKKVAGKPALRQNSPWAFLFAFIYIALLIVPWVFTCLLNKGKFHLEFPKKNYGYHNLTLRAQPEDITFNTNLVHATDILSCIAAVAALPVIFDLLSRAAAGYSQRTSLDKPLSAKELFSLADGSRCDDGGLNYKSENLTIEFCVDGLFQKSPWKLEQYLREDITEEFYVRLSPNGSMVNSGQLRPGAAYRCTGTSGLGYFELGNQFNNGTHGPLVSAPYRTLETAYQAGFHVVPAESYLGISPAQYTISDPSPTMPGPLALALLALFGPGSFSKIAQSIKTADDAVSRTLCQTVPFHFEN
ncbi:hypothetical protein N0V85_003938 [Neurospora sp. IMI 360204]|nr:hypothetical protein N0V85_003938 [Neurospora sp. IMI 360204]